MGAECNERISAFSYTSIIGNKYNYTFGASPTIYVGSAPNSLLTPMCVGKHQNSLMLVQT